jgi:hypothetical protein
LCRAVAAAGCRVAVDLGRWAQGPPARPTLRWQTTKTTRTHFQRQREVVGASPPTLPAARSVVDDASSHLGHARWQYQQYCWDCSLCTVCCTLVFPSSDTLMQQHCCHSPCILYFCKVFCCCFFRTRSINTHSMNRGGFLLKHAPRLPRFISVVRA